MATKVSDLTIDELKDIIRGVIAEYFESENELTDDFARELEKRSQSKDWIDHERVWNN